MQVLKTYVLSLQLMVTDATSTDVYKNLKKFNGYSYTDAEVLSRKVSLLYLIQKNLNSELCDRVLRLIDNTTNVVDIGIHTTKAERIFRATGMNETREETILSLRQAEFVRDRVQNEREITRNITGVLQDSKELQEFNRLHLQMCDGAMEETQDHQSTRSTCSDIRNI